jgi:YcxB-like protein
MAMQERRLKFEVSLTADDLFRANMSLGWRRLVRTVEILGAVALVMVVIDRKAESPFGVVTPLTAVVIAVALFFAPAYIAVMYRRSRKAFKSPRVNWQVWKYIITEKSISASGPTFNAESDWSNVAGVRETKSLFILLPRTILPKRCFPDGTSLDVFRELVRAHVSGKVKLWS